MFCEPRAPVSGPEAVTPGASARGGGPARRVRRRREPGELRPAAWKAGATGHHTGNLGRRGTGGAGGWLKDAEISSSNSSRSHCGSAQITSANAVSNSRVSRSMPITLPVTGRAAEVLGVQQAFLRSLDAVGAVSPARSAGGRRRYTRRQLAFAAGQGTVRRGLHAGHGAAHPGTGRRPGRRACPDRPAARTAHRAAAPRTVAQSVLAPAGTRWNGCPGAVSRRQVLSGTAAKIWICIQLYSGSR
jgi:hypothetical protein